MAISFKEYNEELKILNENKKACLFNQGVLLEDINFLSTFSYEGDYNKELLRLKTLTNDRYYLNENMISYLNNAIKHLKRVKDLDSVYNHFIDDYRATAETFIELSTGAEFKNLADKYMPNEIVTNV